MPREKRKPWQEPRTGEAYRFVPRKIELLVLALLRVALYSRCVAVT